MNIRAAALSGVLAVVASVSSALAETVTVNSTDVYNNGNGALPYGGSFSTPFSGTFSVNGDPFSISGTFSTSSPSYLSFGINFAVTYTGSTPITGTDSVAVAATEYFDNRFGTNCCTWNTGFTGNANSKVGPSSTVNFLNTVNGTNYTSGPYTANASNSPFGIGTSFYAQNADPLPDVFSYTLNFGPGSVSGAQIAINESVSAVPEPSTWAMMVLGFAGVGFMAYRRKRSGPQLRLA